MKSYVYIVQNCINNKCYIGKSNNVKLRWWQHCHKSTAAALHNAINKYGENNFTITILKECDSQEDAFEYERILIKLFNLQDKRFGYNISDGGRGSTGFKVREDTKQLYKTLYTGSKSVHAKFSDIDIINILTEYAKGDITTEELAIKYDCGKSTMIRIIDGESYSNVSFDRNFDTIKNSNRLLRLPSGSANNMAKLTEKDIPYIRSKYDPYKYSYQDLADEFGTTRQAIWYIVKRKTWKHIK